MADLPFDGSDGPDWSLHPGRHWHQAEDGRLQCDVCPRHCRLHEGQRGLCFVRGRLNDKIQLSSYGRSTGFCIDPIEKKPLNHFYPGSPVLSFGTAGCNLTCKFCQNHDMSKARQTDVMTGFALPNALVRAAQDTGCKSIAYTYNDPVIFLEYAVDTAIAAREAGVKNVAVTAGYMGDAARVDFFSHMDAANVDLKAFNEDFYRRLTGSQLGPVLDTLKYLYHETDVWFEITTLLIPDANDDPAEIAALCDWVLKELGPDVPLHFSAFHPDFRMMDVPPTPPGTLLMAREIARKAGIHHVYAGNIHHLESGSSWCASCKGQLIGREWYLLSHWHLDDTGHCLSCGTALPGRFDGPPGDWGRKRQQVNMSQYHRPEDFVLTGENYLSAADPVRY